MKLADLTDQRPALALLQRSLEAGRMGHAYLLSGGSLEELEPMARTLAMALNCQQPPRRAVSDLGLDCCEGCVTCRRIADDTHPDVQWVRPESKLRVVTIDQMRDLMQRMHLKPTEAPFKVAIVVAADRLNVAAANAFLKTLEEPPARSVLLLLTTEPRQVLETVLSRCLRVSLGEGRGPAKGLEQADWLKTFAAVAAQPRQGLLDRYRLLGVLQAELTRIKGQVEALLAQRSPLERYEEIEAELREKWEKELAAAVEAEYRRQRAEVVGAIQWWLRGVWLASLGLSPQPAGGSALAENAQTVASRLHPRDALENLRTIEQTQWLLGSNVQEALALEVGLLKLKL